MSESFELFIIGGGINGMGIAADAAGRGLQVGLCEAQDFASSTSSASSKLIHGGLRYLEHYAFGLVCSALKERTLLLSLAKHLVHPQKFILPVTQQRSRIRLKAGLWIYDHLFPYHSLPKARSILLKEDPLSILQSQYTTAFEFYDSTTDDARLVLANAYRAQEKGAHLYNYTTLLHAKRFPQHWVLTLKDTLTQRIREISTQVLVNATGPFMEQTLALLQVQSAQKMRLVKGSHLVFKALYPGTHAYCLQHPDRRIIFVIPYQEQFTIVGTTDLEYRGNPRTICIDSSEQTYLLDTLKRYFKQPIQAEDIVFSWSGVRPLLDDGTQELASISRESHLELLFSSSEAPLLNIFGGKLTTYRQLAEVALKRLHPFFPRMGPPWTEHEPLPGSDFPATFEAFMVQLAREYPWLPKSLLQRYAKQYGTKIHVLLSGVHSLQDLGEDLGAGLYAQELAYLKEYEWARTAADILWRRTKLGLYLNHIETLN